MDKQLPAVYSPLIGRLLLLRGFIQKILAVIHQRCQIHLQNETLMHWVLQNYVLSKSRETY